MTSKGRATVLASVRDALARGREASTSDHTKALALPRPPAGLGAHTLAPPAAQADPVATFITSAHAVGAEVYTTDDTEREATVARVIAEAKADLDRPTGLVRVERWPGGVETAPFDIDVAVVPAALGITTLGSVMLVGPRLAPMTAEITIAILDAADLVATLHDALITHRPGPTRLLVTGPSKTADIEGVLVTGVHGPRRFIVVLVVASAR